MACARGCFQVNAIKMLHSKRHAYQHLESLARARELKTIPAHPAPLSRQQQCRLFEQTWLGQEELGKGACSSRSRCETRILQHLMPVCNSADQNTCVGAALLRHPPSKQIPCRQTLCHWPRPETAHRGSKWLLSNQDAMRVAARCLHPPCAHNRGARPVFTLCCRDEI